MKKHIPRRVGWVGWLVVSMRMSWVGAYASTCICFSIYIYIKCVCACAKKFHWDSINVFRTS